MKLQFSVIRTSLLVSFSTVLFAVLGGLAFAQEKPSANQQETPQAKFPAAKSQTATTAEADGGGDADQTKEGKAEKDSPESIRKRDEWFYKRRASVNGHIPAGARAQALAHRDRMMEAEGKLVHRPDGSIAEVAPPVAAANPVTTTWTSIGPSPTTGGVDFSPVTGRVTAIAVDPTDTTGNTVLIGGAQGGIWRSTDGGTTWAEVGDQNASLAMGSIAFAPSACNPLPAACTVYAGTGEQASIGFDIYYGAGVLSSTDHGQTWKQTCTTPSASCPFIGPFSDSSVFGFFSFGGARISYIAVNPANPQLVLVGAQFALHGNMEGVYCSADGGATWSNVLPGQMSTFAGFASPTVAYAALGDPIGSNSSKNGIYKSTNANATTGTSCSMTFTSLNVSGSGLPAASSIGRIDMGISPSFAADNTVYASISNGTDGSKTNLGVFVTTNGGTLWTQTAAPDVCRQQCWYDNVIKVDPNNGKIAYFGGAAVTNNGNPIWVVRTTDGGNTWATVIPNQISAGLPHVDNHAITFVKATSGAFNGKVRAYLGNDGGIWRTDDAEAVVVTWNNINDSTLTLTQFYPAIGINASSTAIAYGGTQDNGSQNYQGGTAWVDNNLCGDGASAAVDAIIPTTVYIGCGTGLPINVSYQNGAANTFSDGTNGINLGDSADFIAPITADPSTANVVYYGTTKIYQSVDGATSWKALSADLVAGGQDNFIAIAVAPGNPAVVYAGSFGGEVFVATNVAAGNGTFTKVAGQTSLPTRAVTGIAADPADATGKTAYVAMSGFSFVGGAVNDPKGHIFKTTDGGTTWADVSCTVANCQTPAATDLPNSPANDIVVDPDIPGTLYAATDIGVYISTDGGAHWATLSTGLPRVAVFSLRLQKASRTLFAATHGRGVWAIALNNFAFVGPRLFSLSPTSATSGSAALTLTVNGTGLTGGTIQFNGTALAPVGIGTDTTLSGTVTAALLAAAGTPKVTVTVGANTSNQVTFVVLTGAPTITSSAPASANVNAAATPITVMGTNFTNNSTVLMNPDFNPTSIATTFVSSTQLTATVPASFMANFGSTNSVGVRTPPPGGGTTVTTQTVTLPTFVVKASAPTNDNFANAIAVPSASGTFTDTRDSSAATTETNDPTPACTQTAAGSGRANTIWYKFTPASNGTITDVDTIGSSYDTVLSIWTGTGNTEASLTAGAVACNDDINPGVVIQSQLTNLSVTAGTNYFIMVSSFGPADPNPIALGGKSVFNLTFASAATNSFSMTASTLTPATVTAGSSGTSTITVTPGAGSTGTQNASVTCTNLPPGVTCTPNPLAISATGTTAAMGTLTINVAAPSAQNASASVLPAERTLYAAGITPARGGKGWWLLSGATGLAAILVLLLPGRKKYRAALGLAIICAVSFAIGCGGSSSSGGGGGGGPVATSTKLTVTSLTKGAAGMMFNFTAAVTGGTPTGQVQLMDNGVATGAAVAVSGGMASLTTAALSTVGTHSITAHYAGDANTQSSSSGTLNVTVTGTTTVTVQSSPAASNGSPTINLTIN